MAKFNKLFHNGQLWQQGQKTLNTWFAVSNGKIVDYGHSSNVPKVDQADQVFDLQQKWVFPGFHDCHMHGHLSSNKTNPNKFLKNPKTLKELQNNLSVMVGDDENKGKWLLGYGWDDEIMGEIPNRYDIDQVCTDRPIILYRTCYHLAVANSMALNMCGLNSPRDGFDVFPAGHKHAGELSGLLKEYEQISIVTDKMPPQTRAEKKEDILSSLRACLECGITSVHVQDGDCWLEYEELSNADSLPIHCYLAPSFKDMDTENFPAQPIKSLGRLQCDTVKVFIDGALRAQTAALSKPYVDTPKEGNCGMLQSSKEFLLEVITRINKKGFRLEIHTIGDRAAEVALDCLQEANVPPAMRPIFVHCQILRDDLIDRMVKQGVCTSVQPSFAPHDYNFVKNHLPRELLPFAYAWKTLIKRGVHIGGSSDAPVEEIDPLVGIYDAVFRETDDGQVYNESEKLSFDEAIELYTKSSAYVDGVEDHKGQLERGFDADFVVLSTPLDDGGLPRSLSVNPRLIRESNVHQVWVGGKLAFDKSGN